jgi:hypothetical protein
MICLSLVVPLQLWVAHPWIQPTVDQKYKKFGIGAEDV